MTEPNLPTPTTLAEFRALLPAEGTRVRLTLTPELVRVRAIAQLAEIIVSGQWDPEFSPPQQRGDPLHAEPANRQRPASAGGGGSGGLADHGLRGALPVGAVHGAAPRAGQYSGRCCRDARPGRPLGLTCLAASTLL